MVFICERGGNLMKYWPQWKSVGSSLHFLCSQVRCIFNEQPLRPNCVHWFSSLTSKHRDSSNPRGVLATKSVPNPRVFLQNPRALGLGVAILTHRFFWKKWLVASRILFWSQLCNFDRYFHHKNHNLFIEKRLSLFPWKMEVILSLVSRSSPRDVRRCVVNHFINYFSLGLDLILFVAFSWKETWKMNKNEL